MSGLSVTNIRKFVIVKNVYQLSITHIQRRKRLSLCYKTLISCRVPTLASSLEARSLQALLEDISGRRYLYFVEAPNERTVPNESLILDPRSGRRESLICARLIA